MSINEDSWLQRVRFTAAEPTSWLLHARTLRQAAEDLWTAGNAHDQTPGSELGTTVLVNSGKPDPTLPLRGGSTCDVCFMVFGFALENLLKGILVCRDPTLVSTKELKKWHGNGHDLLALCLRAKIELSPEDKELLARTTRITEWKGRYPVAMNFDKVGAQDRIIGHTVVSSVWPVDEYTRLCGIYDRVKSVLLQSMSDTSPLPDDHKFE